MDTVEKLFDFFKQNLDKGFTYSELGEELDVSIKTIENNLAHLKQQIINDEKYEMIRTYNDHGEIVYLLTERYVPKIKLLPKKYQWHMAKKTPYLVVNFPKLNGEKKINIITLGDLHYGNKACDVDFIKEYVEFIKGTPNFYAILPGDLLENANRHSIGSSIYNQTIPPQEQKYRIAEILAPMAHKILFITMGNHTYNRSLVHAGLDPEFDIANMLKVPYAVGQIFVDLIWGDKIWKLVAFHPKKPSGSGTIWGRLKKCISLSNFSTAEFFVMAHTHDSQVVRDQCIIRDYKTGELILKKRYYVLGGGALQYFNSYAEDDALPPLKPSVAKIELYNHGDYHVSI